MLPLPIEMTYAVIVAVFAVWFLWLHYFDVLEDVCEWHDHTPLHPFHFTKESWFLQLQRRWNWREEKWEYRRREETPDEWADRF
jgi:hypothetical protein